MTRRRGRCDARDRGPLNSHELVRLIPESHEAVGSRRRGRKVWRLQVIPAPVEEQSNA